MKTTPVDKEIIKTDIRQSNIRRTVYITTGAVCINIFILLQFLYNVNSATGITIQWRHSIILLHTVFIIINPALCLIAWYINLTKQFYTRLASFLIIAVFIAMPLWGTIASILDQQVTISIVAFFLGSAVCAMALLIRPVLALLFYSLVYLVFYFGIAVTQTDAAMILSNRVNGFGAIAICCGLSALLWRGNLTRYRQNRLIEEQKKDIQANYEKLLISSHELGKANATKDKFFSIIAHDLRGPVTSTLALAQLLTEKYKDSEQDEMIQMLQSSLSNTSKLLENLLVWSRSQTDEIAFEPVSLNVHKAINTTIEFLKVVASEKNICICNDMPEDVYVLADEEMMLTILRNLLSNAIKFTNDNGRVAITGLVTDDHKVQISMQDNGVGMADDVLKSLFAIDKKITSAGTKNEKGTGLGLILCKEFIEKHNGGIWVVSILGKGSCFTIELPMA